MPHWRRSFGAWLAPLTPKESETFSFRQILCALGVGGPEPSLSSAAAPPLLALAHKRRISIHRHERWKNLKCFFFN